MIDLLDYHKGDCFFTKDNAHQFFLATESFLQLWTWLGKEADKVGELLFSAVPKLHWLWHMAHRARYLNPRRVATFIDEDFVKHIKKLAQACTAGTMLHNVPASVTDKYRWAFALESVEH